MAVSLGTSTNSNTLADYVENKILKTSTGKLILFAKVDNYLKYKTSSDDGLTWDSSWTDVYTSASIKDGFDIYLDNNNNIWIAFCVSSNLYFLKLSYQLLTETWTIGTEILVNNESREVPSINKRSNGDIWIVAENASASYRFNYFISDDGGINWTSSYQTTSGVTSDFQVISVDSDMWVFGRGNFAIRVYKYTGSWDSGTVLDSGNASTFHVLKIANDEIYILWIQTYDVLIRKWNGSSWDSITTLETSASTSHGYPKLANINLKPVAFWMNYEDSVYNVVYRYWNGSSWNSTIYLTNDSTRYKFINLVPQDDYYAYCCYQTYNSPYTIYFDKVLLNLSLRETITSDANIKVIGQQQTINSDAKVIIRGINTINSDATIQATESSTIDSDANIKAIGEQKTILSDAEITLHSTRYINSDARIVLVHGDEEITSDANITAIGVQENILSDALVSILTLQDIDNKVTFVKQTLANIVNKFSFVVRVIQDFSNFINTAKSSLLDITNKINTQVRKLYNIANDIRFLKDFQQAGDYGFQSLGKAYIKVYISSAEITDVDVDSIKIDKGLNSAHTASFTLGRAYDSSKPTMEALVEIKYNDWRLFYGYISEISPGENPEEMIVRCQNKYWLDNRPNKYFFVGHNPQDDKEKYYSTIKEAISTEYSWNVDIGNFVPENIDCFARGHSDILTALISETGNYSWFYDVNENKKLWKAGEGSIITIDRQTLGININLYQLIDHQFNEDVTNIINKYRVQMGDKTIRKFNSTGGNRTYTAYRYSNFQGFCTPAWNHNYEVLAENSSNGYGVDYHKPEDNDLYKDVFRKYYISYLNPEIAGWSDRYPPKVEIYNPGIYYGVKSQTLTEGFTIDFENKLLIFNEPMKAEQRNSLGELVSVRAPVIKLILSKRDYYTVTDNPSEDPEIDVSNPLMFFTDKMGDYPITILKDLNLSSLSIQEGYTYVDEEGVTQVIPSWDDTDFARDYANWQLSKTCDKKIDGNINLTLDALCFYNIDLSKRIYIEGITESPMNITSISYNMANFTVSLTLENSRSYTRTVSLPSRGE